MTSIDPNKHLDHVLEKTEFPNLGSRRKGKVRDIYDQGDKLLLVATDRYSAFDRNLALVPFKGQALTQISRFWFEQTADIVPNHIIEYPDPNVAVVKKCKTLPVEMVCRAYITGVTDTALWHLYEQGQRDFGSFTLPDGMKKNQKLEQTVITPTTKSIEHDKPMTPEEIVKEGVVSQELWDKLEKIVLALFARGQEVAAERGLILVDTKYELGLDEKDNVVLIDEVHTPDSSRYWQKGSYEERFNKGEEPEYFDKEFLRLWFREHSDPYKDKELPMAPGKMVAELSRRYLAIYEQILGKPLEVDTSQPILERIKNNLAKYEK